MSHLDTTVNEDFIYNKDEADRLRSTLNMMYLLAGLHVACTIVAGLFWLFTQNMLPVILIGVCVIALVIIGLVIHKNRPRFMRLLSAHKALNDLLNELVNRFSLTDSNGKLVMGTPANGMLEARMLDEEGDVWDVKAIAPTSAAEGATALVAFHGVVNRTELRSVDTNELKPLTYLNLRILGDATQLVKATAGFSWTVTDHMVTKTSVENETAAAVASLGFPSDSRS